MTVIPIYRPYVFLRCRKCGRKTDHVLINAATVRKGEIEETYECQECGETKKIYELASMLGPQPMYGAEQPTPEVEERLAIEGLEERIKAKRAALEQLESRKRDLEKRLKLTTSVAPAGSQTNQHEKSEEKPKSKLEKRNADYSEHHKSAR